MSDTDEVTNETAATPPEGGTRAPRDQIEAAKAVARDMHLQYVDLDRYPLNWAAAELLPEQMARRHRALAVGWNYGTPVIAMSNPRDVVAADDIRTVVGRDVNVLVATETQIEVYTKSMYKRPRRAGAATPPPPDSPRRSPENGAGGAAATALAEPPSPTTDEAADELVPAGSPEPAANVAASKERSDHGAPPIDRNGDRAPAPPEGLDAEPAIDAPGLNVAVEPALATNGSVVSDAEVAADAEAAASALEAAETARATEGARRDKSREPRAVLDAAPDVPDREDGPAPVGYTLPDVPDAPAELPLEEEGSEAAPAGPSSAVVQQGGGVRAPSGAAAARKARRARQGETPLAPPPRKRDLAELLLDSGKVTPDELEAAKRESSRTERGVGEILVELGLVTEDDLVRTQAKEAGLEFVDLNAFPIDPEAVSLIPEALARRHRVLGIGFREDVPVIAMANPHDVFALDDLRTVIGRDVATVVCSPGQLKDYLQRFYRHDNETQQAARSAVLATATGDASTLSAELSALHAVEDAPIVKYVNLILRQALAERASDVHVEPGVEDLRVRFRIDGVLHDVTRSPRSIHGSVVTRLKVMANLDIAEHRIPQDGRITLNTPQQQVDLRVSTLPTVHGEKVVMRILDKSNSMLELDSLGFLPDVLSRYGRSYRKAYGTILVTGPTGSGKSTTLYATLSSLNSTERNLITIEDPVEYQLPGVCQMQVNPKAGLIFASALRSILRADPDIILVGEIRDRETATIAIEAAITGHLVLSSLHTNDAAGTPMRLIEMGVEPFLVGSALDCVLAQRLARMICDNCAEDHEPTSEELEQFGWKDAHAPEDGKTRFKRAVGCQACSRTGYRGRLAIHEMLLMSEELERLVIARAPTDEIAKVATEQGMLTLREDGLRKAALGLTSIEEILRVVV